MWQGDVPFSIITDEAADQAVLDIIISV